MKIFIGRTMSPRKQSLAGFLISLTTVCASVPAVAAPGDTLSLPDSPEATFSLDQPAGTAFEYLRIAGSTFHPLANTTTYSYPGNGCIAKTGGAENRFVHKVILPQGVVVSYLRLYYFNSSLNNILGFFTAYDAAGNFSERTTVSSADGSSGYSSVLSPNMNYTVDHYTGAINILVNLGSQNDETLRFCGVRIAYGPPVVDRIFTNGFDPSLL